MLLLGSCVVISIMNSCLPTLMEKIVKRLVGVGTSPPPEIETLRRQMEEINMKDDFAKYARLQRQLNKIKDEYKAQARERANTKWKYGLISRYGTQFLMMITCMVMFWNYRSTPVVILKEDWLQPVAGALSWPTYIPGALSFPVWFLMCSTVVKLTLEPNSLSLQ
uniref:Guided entry of tail-anchored proteins factor 1 n=2 Tax=Lygus hesperus TaxID=30085 RepID=A0A0A9WG70_LYGHE